MTTPAATGTSGSAIGSAAGSQARRPGSLTFVAVTAIVLGVLLALGTLTQLVMPALMEKQRAIMAAFPAAGGTSPVADIQADMQRQFAAIAQRHQAEVRNVLPVGALAAIGMIVGGIGCLSARRRGRNVLWGAFALGLLYHGVVTWPTIQMQRELAALTREMMTRIMATVGATGHADPVVGKVMQSMTTVMSGISTAGAVFSVIMALAQATFFVFGIQYLLRPRTRSLFEA